MAERLPNRDFQVTLSDRSVRTISANGYNVYQSGALEFYEATWAWKATAEHPVEMFAPGSWVGVTPIGRGTKP